jgi:hypothetical protein
VLGASLLQGDDQRVNLMQHMPPAHHYITVQAYELPDDTDIWHQLGTEALRQGNHQVCCTLHTILLVFDCVFCIALDYFTAISTVNIMHFM